MATETTIRVLFSASATGSGAELWITDGTTAGTSLLKDINPGGFGSYPGQITALGGAALFVAKDSSHGRDLWISDGTAAGTSLVTEIKSGTGDPAVSGMVSLGSRAVFAANAATSTGSELWVSDGTAGGTSMLMDIRGGSGSSSPSGFAVVGTRAFFNADDGTHGKELWVTDGTAGGTSLVKDINTGFGTFTPSTAADPKYITPFGSRVVFQANDQTHGREIWVSDGTAAGTSMIKDIQAPNFYSSNDKGFTVLGSKVLFDATDGNAAHGYQAWVTDGTAAGTTMLTSMNGTSGGDPRAFTVLGSQALFWATPNGTLGHKTLWVTDGTPGGTSQISNMMPAAGTYNQKMGVVGNHVVFGARPNGSTAAFSLWTTDGTAAGTSEIASASLNSYIYFTQFGGQLAFADGAKHLWVTDGTAGGTSQIGNLLDNFPGYTGPIAAFNMLVPCFAAGTRIRTTRGEVAVEHLRAGDMAIGARDGAAHAIRWIGHRRVDIARHPQPRAVTPIRIAAGAFGPGQPGRDMLLSPDHAVFADGALVPVRHLVNGASIARAEMPGVTYYHVELADAAGAARHDVLLAEGLACESYLDTGNRGAFANGGAAMDLHADFARRIWEADACAPLLTGGETLVALRARLVARAEALGHARTAACGLEVLADGRPVRLRWSGETVLAALPPGIARIRLRSRRVVPAEIAPDGVDGRVLGVALRALRLDGVAQLLNGGRFGSGWHDAELDWRWSDGEGEIEVLGARAVEMVVMAAPAYWRADGAGAMAIASCP